MKGVRKCFGLLSVLVITFGLSLSVFSIDTNALKHEYVGIPYDSFIIPSPSYDSSTDTLFLNWNTVDQPLTTDGSSLELKFEGDSHQSSYSSLMPLYSSSVMLPVFESSDSSCRYGNLFPIFDFAGGSFGSDGFRTDLQTPYHRLFPSSAVSQECNLDNKTIPNFNENSVPLGLLHCDRGNGAVCSFTIATRAYVHDQILPYSYSSDGFFIHSKAISSDTGLQYSNTFSFNDMLNNYIPTFSYLSIPLHTFDGYFLDSSNLTRGRSFEFGGSFEFDGSFAWHDNIENNGSYFRFKAQAVELHGSDSNWVDISVDCTTNLITLGGPNNLTRLDYSCPLTLEDDYVLLTSPRIEISGNGNYVWITDNEWRFASVFLTTDNDDTPGYSFNSEISGGGTIAGDANNLIPDNPNGFMVDANSLDNVFANFTDYLSNLFVFNLFNPFGFIFNLFSDSNSCAQIPTLSGMLHSEETQVCPYFDSTVRNILTPVISIASSMLLFGFILRWIRSSSSDFSPEVIGGK